MKLPRLAAWVFSFMAVCLCAGCGDSYRPVANPITSPGGDPQLQRLALVVYQDQTPLSGGVCADGNAPPCRGATSQIDVPGDSNMANIYVGRSPVSAIFGSSVAVANSADNSISLFAPLTLEASSTTVPTGTNPGYIVYSSGASKYYTVDQAAGSVTVISAAGSAALATVAVGTNPTALALTPSQAYVYVTNRGSNTVSIISTVTDQLFGLEVPVGSNPSQVVTNASTNRMYVLNSGDPSITVFNASTNALLPAPTTALLPAGGNSSFMVYNAQLGRLYVANPGTNSVTVLDATDTTGLNPLQLLKTVSIPNGLATGIASNSPTVAPLADGSRVYVITHATTGCLGEANMGQVAVINTSNNTVSSSGACVTVGPNPVAIAASGESSKVYVAYQGIPGTVNGGTAIINVVNNSAFIAGSTTLRTITPPPVDPNCTSSCAVMTPVYVTSQ